MENCKACFCNCYTPCAKSVRGDNLTKHNVNKKKQDFLTMNDFFAQFFLYLFGKTDKKKRKTHVLVILLRLKDKGQAIIK